MRVPPTGGLQLDDVAPRPVPTASPLRRGRPRLVPPGALGDPGERLVGSAGLEPRRGGDIRRRFTGFEPPGQLLFEALDHGAGFPRRRIRIAGIALFDRLEQLLHELEKGRCQR